MTISTVLLCDNCDAVYAPEGRQAKGALTRHAHAEGWTSTHQHGHWTNTCPNHTTN